MGFLISAIRTSTIIDAMRKTLFIAALSLGLGMAASAATVFTNAGDISLSQTNSFNDSALAALITSPNGNTSPGTGTIMMWVTLDTLPANLSSLIAVESIRNNGDSASGGSLNGWGVMVGSDGKLQICQQNITNHTTAASASSKVTTADGISTGAFHLAISSAGGRNAGNFILYVNGEQVATCTGFGLNGNKFGNLLVGGNGLSGMASGLTVDDSVLDSDGIKAIMESTRPVPEPATASLSLLGLAALMMRRRRA